MCKFSAKWLYVNAKDHCHHVWKFKTAIDMLRVEPMKCQFLMLPLYAFASRSTIDWLIDWQALVFSSLGWFFRMSLLKKDQLLFDETWRSFLYYLWEVWSRSGGKEKYWNFRSIQFSFRRAKKAFWFNQAIVLCFAIVSIKSCREWSLKSIFSLFFRPSHLRLSLWFFSDSWVILEWFKDCGFAWLSDCLHMSDNVFNHSINGYLPE